MAGRAVFVDVPYRPALSVPRPQVFGVQSATVVGPADQEIYTDEFGRVRVQLPWDRDGASDEHSSCWMRVSQGWGGQAYGMMLIPRIGQEVLIGFLEGDPDRPIIIGRLYNRTNPVPYQLPLHKTVSAWQWPLHAGRGRLQRRDREIRVTWPARKVLLLRAGREEPPQAGQERRDHHRLERPRQARGAERARHHRGEPHRGDGRRPGGDDSWVRKTTFIAGNRGQAHRQERDGAAPTATASSRSARTSTAWSRASGASSCRRTCPPSTWPARAGSASTAPSRSPCSSTSSRAVEGNAALSAGNEDPLRVARQAHRAGPAT